MLDVYLHQTRFLHDGKVRTVLLSEQGYHTPDYSEQSMIDKAAAIAYTWEKYCRSHRWKASTTIVGSTTLWKAA